MVLGYMVLLLKQIMVIMFQDVMPDILGVMFVLLVVFMDKY